MPAFRTLVIIARLKWLLIQRHFQRHRANAVGTFLGIIFMLGVAVAGGAFLVAWCRMGGAPARDSAAMWVAWIMAVLWMLAPLMQFDAQRNLDLTGLRMFPLSRATFTWTVILDGALSPIGAMYAPVLIAAVIACTLRPGDLPFVLLSCLLLMAATIGLGQALYLWLNRLLTSRKFTDAAMIIGFVIFMAIQSINLYFHMGDGIAVPAWLSKSWAVLGGVFRPMVDWLFPGLAARALAAASAGQAWGAAGLYGLLAAQTAVCTFCAGLAARQFYEGELESGGQTHKPPAKRIAPKTAWSRGWLTGPLGAMFHRERLYVWRDPLMKTMLMQTFFFLLYLMVMILLVNQQAFNSLDGLDNLDPDFSADLTEFKLQARHGMLLLSTLLLSFSESGVLLNKFGYEGSMAANVLLSPVDRRQVLAAKSLFFITHFAAFNLLIVLFLAYMIKAPLIITLAALALVIHNTAILDLAGHLVSIYLPFTFRRKGRRMRAVMPQPGCGYLMLYTLFFNLANLMVLPGALAIGLGAAFMGWTGLLGGSLFAALIVYSGYAFGLPRMAELLVKREPELLAALSKTPD